MITTTLRIATRLGLAWMGFAAGLLVLGYFLVGAGGVGPAHALDLPVARFLAHHRPPLGVVLPSAAPLLVAPFVALAAMRLIRPHPNDVSRTRAAGALVSSVAGAYLLALVVAGTFARPRPPHPLAEVVARGYSFPSAPLAVMAAVCVAVVAIFPLQDRWRRAGWPACVAAIVAAAAATLVLGVHWLTDVAIGALLGAAWAGCACAIATRSPARVAAHVRLPVHPLRPRLLAGSALAALVLLGPVGWSYGQAMTFPGSAGWQTRSVDWLRSNGGTSLVDWVENFWYARTPDR